MSARLKTINAEEAAYEGFRQLAKECEMTSPELVAAMVQYFRVTKADPRYPTGPDLTTSLAKLTAKLADLDKRTIGFIREQEKTYLKPILAEVQAHKVLNAHATINPDGLSVGQCEELSNWFLHMFRQLILPSQLTPSFLNRELPPIAAKGEEDPALTPIKRAIIGAIKVVFLPELLSLTPKSTPTTSASGAVPSAASAVAPSTNKPA